MKRLGLFAFIRVHSRLSFVLLLLAACGLAADLTPDMQRVVDHISADSLRGHLSFIASDLLEGRATPSRGLDLAAEYIAAQFRRAGLEPAGDDEYFQTAMVADTTVRNVAGLLRGSDPVLRNTYVMLTAHYDHVGMAADHGVFTGANDDGSGTVSVIEIAGALASLEPRPKRSILFVAFFGEERGLLGSHYYASHPIVPLAATIADLNLEQVGRTDASDGPQIGTAAITGFDYSDLPEIVAEAGKLAGIRVFRDPKASDAYFALSDNQPLADAGVPAHTLSVAYQFPDYHKVTDHWDKIDYANMAKVDAAIALALLHLASNATPPKWSESIPAARRYVEAAKKLRAP